MNKRCPGKCFRRKSRVHSYSLYSTLYSVQAAAALLTPTAIYWFTHVEIDDRCRILHLVINLISVSIRDKLAAGVNDTGGQYTAGTSRSLLDHWPVVKFVKLPPEQDLQYLTRDILFVLENVSAPRYYKGFSQKISCKRMAWGMGDGKEGG